MSRHVATFFQRACLSSYKSPGALSRLPRGLGSCDPTFLYPGAGTFKTLRCHFSHESSPPKLSAQIGEILESPVGSIKDTFGWDKVEVVIRDSLHLDRSGDAAFRLVDRLIEEMRHLPESPWRKDLQRLLNAATFQWRDAYIDSPIKAAMYIQPSELVCKIREWTAQGHLQADTAIYTMILEAAGSNANDMENGVEFAESLLDWMFHESHENQNFFVQPTTVSVGVVMKAWVTSGRSDSPQRIEAWFERLHSCHEQGWLNLRPNTVVYNMLIHALAEQKDATRAEEVLQSLLLSQNGVGPDSISFSTVLLAYTRLETLEAMQKADTLLNQMIELYEAGLESAKPNVISFSTLMQGHAQLGQGEEAEKLLRRLQMMYKETRDPDWEPDAAAFTIAMSAWSKAGKPDRANGLLQEVLSNSLAEIDERAFRAVLSGWAKAGEPEQAESLLQQMHDLHTSGSHETPPTLTTYNLILGAWANSGRIDAWRRAVEILRHMEDLALNDDELKPNDRTWNAVFKCFRYCGQGEFHHAFKLLDDFFVAAEEERVNGKPNLITWNTLLASCVNNTKDDHRLRQIWKRMFENHCKPDIITYNKIFACYARYAKHQKDALDGFQDYEATFREDKGLVPTRATVLALVDAWIAFGQIEKAENVLKELCRVAATTDDWIADREPFHRVLLAWSNKIKPRRVESIVLLMEELCERSGFSGLKPTVKTYNILLHAWARSNERQSGERADLILREMNARGIVADLVSYNSAVNAWANSGDPTASTKIESLILEMILRGNPALTPDHATYNTWMKAILKGKESNQERRMNELLKTMKIHNLEPSQYILDAIRECRGQKDGEVLKVD